MSHRVMSRDNAAHYVWGEGCDGWRLVDSEALSIIEERMPPGASEAPHLHRRAEQFFYVLEGEAEFHLEGERHRVTPGCGLHIPPGVRHRVVNAGAADLRFVLTSRPNTRGDRVEDPKAAG